MGQTTIQNRTSDFNNSTNTQAGGQFAELGQQVRELSEQVSATSSNRRTFVDAPLGAAMSGLLAGALTGAPSVFRHHPLNEDGMRSFIQELSRIIPLCFQNCSRQPGLSFSAALTQAIADSPQKELLELYFHSPRCQQLIALCDEAVHQDKSGEWLTEQMLRSQYQAVDVQTISQGFVQGLSSLLQGQTKPFGDFFTASYHRFMGDQEDVGANFARVILNTYRPSELSSSARNYIEVQGVVSGITQTASFSGVASSWSGHFLSAALIGFIARGPGSIAMKIGSAMLCGAASSLGQVGFQAYWATRNMSSSDRLTYLSGMEWDVKSATVTGMFCGVSELFGGELLGSSPHFVSQSLRTFANFAIFNVGGEMASDAVMNWVGRLAAYIHAGQEDVLVPQTFLGQWTAGAGQEMIGDRTSEAPSHLVHLSMTGMSLALGALTVRRTQRNERERISSLDTSDLHDEHEGKTRFNNNSGFQEIESNSKANSIINNKAVAPSSSIGRSLKPLFSRLTAFLPSIPAPALGIAGIALGLSQLFHSATAQAMTALSTETSSSPLGWLGLATIAAGTVAHFQKHYQVADLHYDTFAPTLDEKISEYTRFLSIDIGDLDFEGEARLANYFARLVPKHPLRMIEIRSSKGTRVYHKDRGLITNANALAELAALRVNYQAHQVQKIKVVRTFRKKQLYKNIEHHQLNFLFRTLRESKGWTGDQLSEEFERIGISFKQSTVSAYESEAKRSPDLNVLKGYARLFEIDLDQLIYASNLTRYGVALADYATSERGYPLFIAKGEEDLFETLLSKDPQHQSLPWLILESMKDPKDYWELGDAASRGYNTLALKRNCLVFHEGRGSFPLPENIPVLARALKRNEEETIDAINFSNFKDRPEILKALAHFFPGETIYLGNKEIEKLLFFYEELVEKKGEPDLKVKLRFEIFSARLRRFRYFSAKDLSRKINPKNPSYVADRERGDCDFTLDSLFEWVAYVRALGLEEDEILASKIHLLELEVDSPRWIFAKAVAGADYTEALKSLGASVEEFFRDFRFDREISPYKLMVYLLAFPVLKINHLLQVLPKNILSNVFPELEASGKINLEASDIDLSLTLNWKEFLQNLVEDYPEMSQNELSVALGFSPTMLSKHLRGVNDLSYDESLLRAFASGYLPHSLKHWCLYLHPELLTLPLLDNQGCAFKPTPSQITKAVQLMQTRKYKPEFIRAFQEHFVEKEMPVVVVGSGEQVRSKRVVRSAAKGLGAGLLAFTGATAWFLSEGISSAWAGVAGTFHSSSNTIWVSLALVLPIVAALGAKDAKGNKGETQVLSVAGKLNFQVVADYLKEHLDPKIKVLILNFCSFPAGLRLRFETFLRALPSQYELRVLKAKYPEGVDFYSRNSGRREEPEHLAALMQDRRAWTASEVVEVEILSAYNPPTEIQGKSSSKINKLFLELRNRKGWSTQRLSEEFAAHHLSFKKPTVSVYECNPLRSHDFNTLRGYSEIFEIPLEDLIYASNLTRFGEELARFAISKRGYPLLIENEENEIFEKYKVEDPHRLGLGWLVLESMKDPKDYWKLSQAKKRGYNQPALIRHRLEENFLLAKEIPTLARVLKRSEDEIVRALNGSLYRSRPEVLEALGHFFPGEAIYLTFTTAGMGDVEKLLDFYENRKKLESDEEYRLRFQIYCARLRNFRYQSAKKLSAKIAGKTLSYVNDRESGVVGFRAEVSGEINAAEEEAEQARSKNANCVFDWVGFVRELGLNEELVLAPMLHLLGLTRQSLKWIMAKAVAKQDYVLALQQVGVGKKEFFNDLCLDPKEHRMQPWKLVAYKLAFPALNFAKFSRAANVGAWVEAFPEIGQTQDVLKISQEEIELGFNLDWTSTLTSLVSEKKVAQIELSRMLNLDESSVNRYLSGQNHLPLDETLITAHGSGHLPQSLKSWIFYLHPELLALPLVNDRGRSYKPSPAQIKRAIQIMEMRGYKPDFVQAFKNHFGIKEKNSKPISSGNSAVVLKAGSAALAGIAFFLGLSSTAWAGVQHMATSHPSPYFACLGVLGIGLWRVFDRVVDGVSKAAEVVTEALSVEPDKMPTHLAIEPVLFAENLEASQVEFIRNQFRRKPLFNSKVALAAEIHSEYLQALHACAAGNISFQSLILKLMFLLREDFVNKAEKQGMKVTRQSLAKWLESRREKGLKNPEWLEAAVLEDKNLGNEELVFLSATSSYLLRGNLKDISLITATNSVYERVMNFERGTLANLVGERDLSDSLNFTLLPYSLVELARKKVLKTTLDLLPCAENLNAAGVEAKVKSNVWPLQLWRYFKSNSHPYAQAFHDVFHWLWLGAMSEEARADGLNIYHAFQLLPLDLRALVHEDIAVRFYEGVMDGFSSEQWGNFNPLEIFKRFFKHVSKNTLLLENQFVKLAASFRESLSKVFAENAEKKKMILDAFDQALAEQHPRISRASKASSTLVDTVAKASAAIVAGVFTYLGLSGVAEAATLQITPGSASSWLSLLFVGFAALVKVVLKKEEVLSALARGNLSGILPEYIYEQGRRSGSQKK